MIPGSTAPNKYREPVFEEVVLNEPFGPIQELVDDFKIKKFAFTVDDYYPWYFGPSPFGKRIGHAAILVDDLVQLFKQVYNPHTVMGLHTQEEIWFVNPVFEGERVRLYGEYVEKYVRRGKGYVVMNAEARGEDGRVLLRHRGVEILRIVPGTAGAGSAGPPEVAVTGEYRKDLPPVASARLGILPGTSIVPLTKTVHQEQMSVFSGIGKHLLNTHTDLGAALSGGLKDTIVQGMMEFCYCSEMLTQFFGPAWFHSGWLKMKFIRPVYRGEKLNAFGAVIGETEDAGQTKISLEVWVRNSAGELTAVGWASGAAPLG